MATLQKDLGAVTAYAYAVQGGYEGTPSEFATLLGNFSETAQDITEAMATKANLVDGKVPSSELPSYVDDVIEGYYYNGAFYEDSAHTTAITGEQGKIYVDLSEDSSYRWSGTAYINISNPIDVDSSLSTSSINPVQNSTITGKLPTINGTAATSGSYPADIWTPTSNGDANSYLGGNGSSTAPTFYTPDSTPTNGSNKLVTSGGVYTALSTKQNVITPDTTPTSGSTNLCTSGGIYTALQSAGSYDLIGDAYSSSVTYGPIGNSNSYPTYCISNNILYKNISSCRNVQPPNASHWVATDTATEITTLNNSLTEDITNLFPFKSGITATVNCMTICDVRFLNFDVYVPISLFSYNSSRSAYRADYLFNSLPSATLKEYLPSIIVLHGYPDTLGTLPETHIIIDRDGVNRNTVCLADINGSYNSSITGVTYSGLVISP